MNPAKRLTNRIAWILQILALVCFAVFHFVRFSISVDPGAGELEFMGWWAWRDLVEMLRHIPSLEFEDLLIMSSFVTGALLMIASPFLGFVFRTSRLAWWIGILSSGAVMLALGLLLIPQMFSELVMAGPGFYCLHAGLLLNFLGFLLYRREIRADPGREVP